MSQTLDPHPREVQRGHLSAVPGASDSRPPAPADDRPGGAVKGRLHIEPWIDPVVEEVGHDPRSAYAETYWLPVLGPSVTWMLRRFASLPRRGSRREQSCPAEELARSLGIGDRSGPNGPLPRTLKRCVDFEMAEWRGASLAVRRKLPPLARRHLRRLPETLQARHFEEVESARIPTTSERLRVHGCRLALSLMEFGEDRAAAEQQLVRWAFHPALAAMCATWAAIEQRERDGLETAHPAGSGQAGGSGRRPAGRAETAIPGRPQVN